jgi:hypothetical protein
MAALSSFMMQIDVSLLPESVPMSDGGALGGAALAGGAECAALLPSGSVSAAAAACVRVARSTGLLSSSGGAARGQKRAPGPCGG